ncbi:hypothetical protein D3C81_1719130 [compost metagenome]
MLAGFLEKEKRGFGVNRHHLVILSFGDLGHRLFQHLAHSVDRNIRAPDCGHGIAEQLFHGTGSGQVCLQRHRLGSQCLESRHGGVGIALAGGAVVMHHHSLSTLLGEIAGEQAAEIFHTAGDQYDLAVD